MTLGRAIRFGGLSLLLGLLVAGTHPAMAQVTFGSPNDPPRFALGGGAFDVLPEKKRENAGVAGLALSEYRFGDVWWILSPFIGAMGTGKGSFYGYFGLGFDINFPGNFVLTPSAAAGYFESGGGISLGSWWEFRTGAEFDYRFPDNRRVGIGFYHMSNAGLGKENPGIELATFVVTVPFR